MARSGDREVDVVVVGSGSSGSAAALAARDHGFDALLLEKGSVLGGGTSYSSGFVWIPENYLEHEAGIADSKAEGAEYLRFLGAGYQVEENLRAYIDNGPIALRYFADLGLKFQIARNIPDVYFGMAPGAKREGRMLEIQLISGYELGEWRERVLVSPFTAALATFDEAVQWGGRSHRNWDRNVQVERRAADMRASGAGLVAAFVKALLDRNVPILLEAPALRLVVEEERVTGVVATVDGRETTIRAREAVVLATGGYEGNPDLIRNYEDLPGLRNMFPATITGDGLVMASEIGAKVRVIPHPLSIFLGYDVPARNGKPAMFRNAGTSEIPQPHSMIVNRAGKRFGDESFFQKLQQGVRHFDVRTHSHPNTPCYWVFDSQFREKYSLSGLPIGEIPDFFSQADTPHELAERLGVDSEGLLSELRRFNGFVSSGRDEDFGRGGESWSRNFSGDHTSGNPNLGSIEKAPFYGIELHPSGAPLSAGILTDAKGQVMNQRGKPIEGLYALANCSAGIEYGVGYQAGLTLGKGMIFAYLAVKHLQAQRV